MWCNDFEIYDSFDNIVKPRPPDEKGLRNNFGENNCFLNVVIQSLWHLDSFRNRFLSHKMKTGHRHGDNCMYCALEVIFTQYEFSDEGVLPPTALRETLAVLFKPVQRFQLFQIDDAAEALEAVLDRLHGQFRLDVPRNQHELTNGAGIDDNTYCHDQDCIAHQVFGLNVVEQLKCKSCGSHTAPLKSTMFTAYTYAASLRNASLRESSIDATFCQLLNKANADMRYCPNREHCNNICPLERHLIRFPEVFAVGVVWDSLTPSLDDIGLTLKMITQRLDLNNVFPATARANPCYYRLRGMIAYYGKHYIIFLYNQRRREWLVYDDVMVKAVGATWPEVQQRCLKGHLQPSVLLYECEDFSQTKEILPLNFLHVADQLVTPQQIQQQQPSSSPSSEQLPKKESDNNNNNDSDHSIMSDIIISPTSSSSTSTSSNNNNSNNNSVIVNNSSSSSSSTTNNNNNNNTIIHHPPIRVSKLKNEDPLVHNNTDNNNNNDNSSMVWSPTQSALADVLKDCLENEDEFVIVPSDNIASSFLEELDFIVIRTNWLYRRQVRRLRFKSDCFVRVFPGSAEIKEVFEYMDVLDITLADPRNIIIRFFSGKESQYIESDRAQELIDIVTHRSKLLGHSFPIKKL